MRMVVFIRNMLAHQPTLYKIGRFVYRSIRHLYALIPSVAGEICNRSKGDLFPSDLIHTNDKRTLDNWGYLQRGYDDEPQIKDLISKIRSHTMVTHDGLLVTYDIARYLVRSKIEGSFVEAGVHRGGSAAMMAYAALQQGGARRLHLFDSFEGIPNPSAIDYEEWMEDSWGVQRKDANGLLVASGKIAAEKHFSEELLSKTVGYPMNQVTFHVGWFQNTVPTSTTSIGPIALLRLDGDLYESTLVCLRHLYPLVVRGGFIIVDDYLFKGCRLACDEYFAEIGAKPYMHHIDKLAKYFIKT